MDTSSAKQDDVDIGRDGADRVGGTEPRPRGFPPLTETARHPAAGQAAESRQGLRRKQLAERRWRGMEEKMFGRGSLENDFRPSW